MHESNVSQLQLTVDRMLNEARERQKTYSNEKKQLLDDKVTIVVTHMYVYICTTLNGHPSTIANHLLLESSNYRDVSFIHSTTS